MLRQFLIGKPSVFDEPIAVVLTKMNTADPGSDEYKALITDLEALNRMKAAEAPTRVSADTKWLMVTNVIITVIVVGYEQKDVVVTKALGFIHRPKMPNI